MDRIVVDGDSILDFFAGSSSTADAVMQLADESHYRRLRYVMVQIPEKIYTLRDGVEVPLQKKAAVAAFRMGFRTIDEIGMERIKRAAAKIRDRNPDTTADLGFLHFTLSEPSGTTLDKLEQFSADSSELFADSTILAAFGVPTVLTTWLVQDGYGFTASMEKIDFSGYPAYYAGKHLYLITPQLPASAIAAIVSRFETDGAFNPENIVLFGYSFTWTELEALKMNLIRLRDTEKNLRINFDIRY